MLPASAVALLIPISMAQAFMAPAIPSGAMAMTAGLMAGIAVEMVVVTAAAVIEDFNDTTALMNGLPTVQNLAQKMNISPGYLSDLLRSLTGHNAQQHIHYKLIEKAKVFLSTTNMSVSEVAYQLGFEHPQSFSKLFRTKEKRSPLEFRQSFN
jgi:AraC-like DNA-binding protein